MNFCVFYKCYRRIVLKRHVNKVFLLTCRCSSTEPVLDPAYKPHLVENRQLKNVQKVKNSDTTYASKVFSMILPPPNVTGYMHLGHCLTATVQDVIARHKQATGHKVEWIPGSDHAGIATQVVVEKVLKNEKGLTRHELGRDKFLDEVWKWQKLRKERSKEDLQRLGTTLDWSKEYFTLDDKHSHAVREAFIRLFEKGLIYRSDALVNWSCTLESAISDIEVENLEVCGSTFIEVPGYKKKIKFGQIYDIIYRSTTNEDVVVSTTRPETLLGDVAVAVHPNDLRYTNLINNQVQLHHPFRGDSIPVIADDSVDPEFGSGAVKITPGHDKSDFEVAKRHKLPLISIFDSKGVIVNDFDQFAGLPRLAARNKMIEVLAEKGLLKSVKDHSMILPICSRSKDVVEFILKPQWFVNCKDMSKRTLEAVQSGVIKLEPESFHKDWERWLTDCRDWCISRQLWWGHRIPAWHYIDENGECKWIAAHNKEEALKKVNKTETHLNINQDEDVLDTWFSSALLPFSLNEWPENLSNKSYPLSLMETGHDILFFWVARMAMLGIELTQKPPFKSILLHGIVCDSHGRKMSKSLGNVITPDQVINGSTLEALGKETKLALESGVLSREEYEKSIKGQKKMFPNGIPECGADALRFTLCSHNIKSHFINFDIQECLTNKLFFNKIWQATRYTIGFCDKIGVDWKNIQLELNESDKALMSEMDRWILSRLINTKRTVDESIESYNFYVATSALKTFFYTNFCDTYLETTKRNQLENRKEQGLLSCKVLMLCITNGLNLMAAFTPFLSNELSSLLPKKHVLQETWLDNDLEVEIDQVLDVCFHVRQSKSTQNITRKHKPVAVFYSESEKVVNLLKKYNEDIKTLSMCSEIQINPDDWTRKFTIKTTIGPECSFGISVEVEPSNINKMKNVNVKKLEKLEKSLEKLVKLVTNEGYKEAVSLELQKKHNEKIQSLKTEIDNIKAIN